MEQAPLPFVSALADRYRLDRELGQGGMATVYLAEDLKHHRKVALKVLRPELAAAIGAERFLAEIRTTANLQHPHILPLFDSGTTEGPDTSGPSMLYYVMPYVEGESLRDRLAREQQLPIDDALRIAREVASALDYAHRHGVIHRDIKPENILLHDGQALVADFGIALAVTQAGGSRLTETGVSIGTPHYMSPEQASGERVLDARSDIYSLGCVLYEMLAGEPPFTGPTLQAITSRKLHDSMPSLKTVRELVPAGVEAAIRRALAKAPADRYQTARQFADALEGSGGAVGRGGAPAPPLPTRSPWRARLPWAVAAGFAIIAAVLAWRSFSSRSAGLPVTRLSMQPLPGGSIFLGTSAARSLDISPDGRRVVYVGIHGSDTVSRLFVRELSTGTTISLGSTEGAYAPFFKPDGEWIGYFEMGTDRLMKVPARGGQPQLLCGCGPSAGADWGGDGWIVFDPSGGRALTGLLRVREEGGKPDALPLSDSTYSTGLWNLVAPQLLPGGEAVLVTATGAAPSRVSALSLKTGKRTDLVTGGAWLGRYVEPGYLVYAKALELWAVRFDPRRLVTTGEPVLVVDSVQSAPDAQADYAVSRSGTLVYAKPLRVTGRDGLRLVWVDRNDRIEPIAAVPGGYWFGPRISPDGNRVIFWGLDYDDVEGGRLWLYDRLRGAPRAVTDASYTSAWPIFTADGRGVVSNSNREEKTRFPLYRTPIEGGGLPVRLTTLAGGASAAAMQQPSSWSPDGRTLAFQQGFDPQTKYDIYLLSAGSDSGARPLLATKANERAPVFSPDGKWLAYVSDESGRFEVYLRRWPAFDEPVQVTRDGGDNPAWAADGREIFYRRGAGLFTVPFEAGRLGEPRQLINGMQRGSRNALASSNPYGRTYDVARDGRFLMLQMENSVSNGTEYQVVLNWATELQSRFQGAK